MQATHKSFLQTALVALTLCFSTAAMAKIYKWTDANGKTHYTATPPPAKASAEEFKVQKTKKSSLTHIDTSKPMPLTINPDGSEKKNIHTINPKLSAQTQCKNASKNLPKMHALMKTKIEESKSKGIMTQAQYDKAMKQMRDTKNDKSSFAECVKKYNSGDKVEINQLANNDPEIALTYLAMKAHKEKIELKDLLKKK